MRRATTIILALLFSSTILAKKLEQGSTYLLQNGSISTTDNEVVPQGTYIKVVKQDSWSTHFQVLDEKMAPKNAVKRASTQWAAASAVEIGPRDIKGILDNVSVKVPDPNENCCQPGTNHKSRDIVAPAPVATSPASLKDDDALASYFSCYQRNSSHMMNYRNKFKQSIRESAKTYNQLFGDEVSENEVNTTLSCLLFRESSHWEGKTSATGAVGLGQFTGVAISQVKKILTYKSPPANYFENRINTQRNEHKAKRISASNLQKNIRLIEAEKRNHDRLTELKNLWEKINIRNRPTANQINANYLKNNENHEAVIALSTLMIRNCQIQLQDRNFEMSQKDSLLACAGAYNMGVGGFVTNALGDGKNQNLNTWITNLKKSGSSQKAETINHIISIHRCSQKDANLPPCGTSSNYCTDLPKANACNPRANPICEGEC